jgi:GMP synthase (glutamine-hydrolysing)
MSDSSSHRAHGGARDRDVPTKNGTALALRHVMFEDAGLISPVLQERGIKLDYVDVPSSDLAQVDALSPSLLVILGGPIGVYEDEDYPWLETVLICARLEARRPTLGICMGAQLMAKVLGARAYPGATKEIGWAPVTLTEEGRQSALVHIDGTPVLHWHGDIFDLPEGAARLASTKLTPNQAFAIGDYALGLQFHLETYGRDLERWFVGHTVEIAATPSVNVWALRVDTEKYSSALERCGRLAFRAWLDRVF